MTEAYASATGKFVKNPKAMDAMPEMAAVPVIKSRLIAAKKTVNENEPHASG